jgi:hypothetical protein
MAEIQPLYTVDELIELKAEGPDDEDESKKVSKALNWYFRERLRGYERLDEGVQDALLVRNGYLKIWPETSWRLPYETTLVGTADQIDAELAQLAEKGAQVKEYTAEVVEGDEGGREILQEAVWAIEEAYSPDGLEMVEIPVQISPEIQRVEIQVIEKVREVKAETIAREDIGTSTDGTDQDLQKNRFTYHRRRMTRNQVVALGFYQKDVYALTSEDNSSNQVASEREEGMRQFRDNTAADPGGDIVSLYECWYQVDADGDGIAELHQIFYGESNRIMRWAGPEGGPGEYADEIVRVVPIASGVALRVAHRHLGRSLFDKEKGTEDSRRTLKQQMNNNLHQANDKEFLIGEGASEDDFELGFSGGYKRCVNPMTDAVELKYNPIIAESLQALAYYDRQRSERGGQALDNASQEKPSNIQASTFERWMSGTERTTAMYIRNLSNSMIRDAFILLYQALKTMGETFDFQDGDSWERAEPRFWIERERFSVKLGKSEGERIRLIGGYDAQMNRAAEAVGAGGEGVVTDWNQRYEMLVDQADLMGVENHWLDPNRQVSMEPGPNGQPVPVTAIQAAQKAQQAQQKQAADAQNAQTDKMLSLQAQIATLQEETKRQKNTADAINDTQETIQKGLDSLRDFIAQQTKTEAEYGVDVPGGTVTGDEELGPVVTQ